MNRERRKEIVRATGLIDEAMTILAAAEVDERDYYDNMPESLQGGEKGTAAEAAADALQEAVDKLDEALDACNTATE